MIRKRSEIEHIFNDGGRATAGFTGETYDCVTRAVAIITENPYREVYDNLYRLALGYASDNDDKVARAMRRAMEVCGAHWKNHPDPNSGVNWEITDRYLLELDWFFWAIVPDKNGMNWMKLSDFTGFEGRYVVRLIGHSTAVIDGKVYDTFNPEERHSVPVIGFWRRYQSPIDEWVGRRQLEVNGVDVNARIK